MAIGLAPKYIKAYLRRAQALELLERYEDSLKGKGMVKGE